MNNHFTLNQKETVKIEVMNMKFESASCVNRVNKLHSKGTSCVNRWNVCISRNFSEDLILPILANLVISLIDYPLIVYKKIREASLHFGITFGILQILNIATQ